MLNNNTLENVIQSAYNSGGFPVQGGTGDGGFPEQGGSLRDGGLSYAHIRPSGQKDAGLFMCWREGNLIKAVRPGTNQPAIGGGKRGQVVGLSRAARRRMMYQLCMTKKDAKPLFITLTYPDLFDRDPRIWKRDLKVFFQRLARMHPAAAAFWRLELKRRLTGQNAGIPAPHFHMLMWGLSYGQALSFVKEAWWGVVGSQNEDHYKAGTRVEVVRADDGVKRYASKYASKSDDDEQLFLEAQKFGKVGRLWGKFNETLIPWSSCLEVPSTDAEVVKLFRLMRRYAHLKMRSFTPSMTLMVNSPVQWLRPLRC